MKYIIALLLLFSSCSTTGPNKPDFLKVDYRDFPPPFGPCWKLESDEMKESDFLNGPNKIKESDFLDGPNKYNLLFDDRLARKPFVFDKDDKDFC